MILDMVKEFITIQTGRYMGENGFKINNMVKDPIYLQMVINMTVRFKMEKNMDLVNIFMVMGTIIKDNGMMT